MKFLYLDECKDIQNTKIVSLTGIVVDSEKYIPFRDYFYDNIIRYIRPSENIIDQAPELHGSKLLPGAKDDEERLEVLAGLVKIVASTELRIYRSGYYATDKMIKVFKGVDGIVNMCLLGISKQCQPEYENDMLLPVMDGFNKPMVDSFSFLMKFKDVCRAAGFAEDLLSNAHNLCEMHFADSAHSIFLQTADILSYLLHIQDYEREKMPLTEFKSKLLQISKGLMPSVIKNKVVLMKHT